LRSSLALRASCGARKRKKKHWYKEKRKRNIYFSYKEKRKKREKMHAVFASFPNTRPSQANFSFLFYFVARLRASSWLAPRKIEKKHWYKEKRKNVFLYYFSSYSHPSQAVVPKVERI